MCAVHLLAASGLSRGFHGKQVKEQNSAIVVGAGITGLTAALLLSKKNISVTLYESDSVHGGMLAPVCFDGFELDRGSHRVHPEAHPLLLKLTAEADWRHKERRGTLILNRRRLPYPLDPIRFIAGLGFLSSISMAYGWLRRPNALRQTVRWEKERKEVAVDEGFESFVVRRVGRSAYRRFYEPYARKVWGIEPKDLSQTVAKQRVSTTNPAQSIFKKSQRQFLYPASGMSSLIELLRKKNEDAGVQINLDTPFKLSDAENKPTFYTGHLHSVVPDSQLSYRGLYLVYLVVEQKCLDDTDTWYAPETRYWFGRVSQPAQFSELLGRPEQRILCVEIPEGNWGAQQDFTKQAQELVHQLRDAKILKTPGPILDIRQVFLPQVYPMYRRDWVHEQRRALMYLAQRGKIYPCGRQGLFLHCNMDQAVATAEAAVKHYLSGGSPMSWVTQCQNFADFRVRD
ncbi:MAG: UDP-galactopyranose mutase [Myxococcales bacterium]|nr:UDP-galactopyranose mutase [Myxococcales bacterium]